MLRKMKHKYTPKQKRIMKEYWRHREEFQNYFYKVEEMLEKEMNKDLRKEGLKEKMEYFITEFGGGIACADPSKRKKYHSVNFE